jgi:hypothetical protein
MNFVKSICEICIHTSYCGVDENDEECYFEEDSSLYVKNYMEEE